MKIIFSCLDTLISDTPDYDDLNWDSKEHYYYKIQIFLLMKNSVPSFWDKHPAKKSLSPTWFFCKDFFQEGTLLFINSRNVWILQYDQYNLIYMEYRFLKT